MTKQFVKIHHVEICVESETTISNLFQEGFRFERTHYRQNNYGLQNVYKSDTIVFVTTVKKNTSSHVGNNERTCDFPMLFCCNQNHKIDSVFNVCFEVNNINEIVDKIKTINKTDVVSDIYTIQDQFGPMKIAVIKSMCTNIIHTLIQKVNYSGTFVPGFLKIDQGQISIPNIRNNFPTTFIDHVTYACHPGESQEIIRWYENIFKMRRFLTNKEESIEDGFVLDEGIGLRLKALQYWQCSETGVGISSNDNSVIRIVIAEPLPHIESSHISNFLNANCGPGIQHIGLHSNSIIDSVQITKDHGVRFRKTPPTYYQECGKLSDIEEVGLKDRVEELRQCGILIDAEEDLESSLAGKNKKFLMQVFTYPVFDVDTFFLEIIQREGATGFGVGNITALAKSIAQYQEEQRQRFTTKRHLGIQELFSEYQAYD